MTSLPGLENTALLVIDVQVGVVAGAYRRDEVVHNICTLVAGARSAGVPVVWVQHSDAELEYGSSQWELVPELVPGRGEVLIHKRYGDAFEDTQLGEVLGAAGARHLVVAGAETDACVRSTIHGAFTRGYDVTLVGDAHTASDKSAWGAPPVPDVIAHTNLYWSFQAAPGREAAVIDTKDVAFVR